MASTDDSAVWVQKGATLSDKTAQKEFGLREEDIIQAIKAGKLQYRHNTLYGNPCLKLLREEVECLVNEKYGLTFPYRDCSEYACGFADDTPRKVLFFQEVTSLHLSGGRPISD